jgi:hypothetical protein
MLSHFIDCVFLRHPVLFQGVDALFGLVPETRQRDDVVINLRNNFVNDLKFAFLSKYKRGVSITIRRTPPAASAG